MDNNINLGYSNFFSSVRKSNLVNILPTNVQTINLGEKSVTTSKIADLAVGTAQIDNAAITNAKISDLSANKITAGTLSATTSILINDGTNDIILIGYQSGGF